LLIKIGLEPGLLGFAPLAASQEMDIFSLHQRQHDFIKHPVLLGHQPMSFFTDGAEGLLGGQVIRLGTGGAQLRALNQTRRPHFEEFIEIGAGYAEKIEPLQQGCTVILGLFQDSAVELQETQFLIDVIAPVVQVDCTGFGAAVTLR